MIQLSDKIRKMHLKWTRLILRISDHQLRNKYSNEKHDHTLIEHQTRSYATATAKAGRNAGWIAF